MPILLKFLFVAVLIWIFWGPIQAWYVWWALRKGLSTEAEVIQREQKNGRHFATYSFQVGSIKYRKRLAIRKRTYQRLSNGGAVLVRYSPNNPKLSRVVGDNLDRDIITVGLMVGLLWVILSYLFLIR